MIVIPFDLTSTIIVVSLDAITVLGNLFLIYKIRGMTHNSFYVVLAVMIIVC